MLDVDVGGHAAHRLGLSDDVLSEGGLAGRLRPKDLGYSGARDATDAQRQVQRQRSGGDRLHMELLRGLAQAHDRPLAKPLLDLAQCHVQRVLLLVGCHQKRLLRWMLHRLT